MNYWPSEITNLGELQDCHLLISSMLCARARRTASEVYGMKGIVAHYTTDVWHYTEPTRSSGLRNVANGNSMELSEYLGPLPVWRRH